LRRQFGELVLAKRSDFPRATTALRVAKRDLFGDLVEVASRAGVSVDTKLLDRIAEYVCWAAEQTDDGPLSAIESGKACRLMLTQPVGVTIC